MGTYSTISEESAKTRVLTRKQHDTQVAKAKKAGGEFITLSNDDINKLKELAEPVLAKWGKKIGPAYLAKVRQTLK